MAGIVSTDSAHPPAADASMDIDMDLDLGPEPEPEVEPQPIQPVRTAAQLPGS